MSTDLTVEVPLSLGLVALINAADAPRVLAVGSWHAKRSKLATYAARSFSRTGDGQRTVRLHTFLTGWLLVDHVNGDTLDNRRANLREATRSGNSRNASRRNDNTSGFKGVSRKGQGWRACIRVDGRWLHLGCHATPEDAAIAYDSAARELHGEFAAVNFPHAGERAAIASDGAR